MNIIKPSNDDEMCEAALWALVEGMDQATRSDPDMRRYYPDHALKMEKEDFVQADGRLWSKHQCQKCGMAIMRSWSITDDSQSQYMVNPDDGTCPGPFGQEVIQRYPVWQNENL